MAEYGREQRNQLSRTIANSGTGGKQMKEFVDNRNSICATNFYKHEVNKVIQSKNLMIQMADSKGYKKAYTDAIATGKAINTHLGKRANPPTNSKWDGDNTTWHHIIPRNELEEKMTTIGTWIHWLSKMENDEQIVDKSDFITVHDVCEKFGLKDDGNGHQKLGRNYYCTSGNGFIGPASKNRKDDPGGNREPKSPKNFPRWDAVINWATKLTEFAANVTTIEQNPGTDNDAKVLLDNMKGQLEELCTTHDEIKSGDAYLTKKAKGDEWSYDVVNEIKVNCTLV